MVSTRQKPPHPVLRRIVLVAAAVVLWFVAFLAYALSPYRPLRGLD